MPRLEGHPGLDRALASGLGLAFAALLLLPTTRLLDPKAVAALALASLLFLGAALALASDAPHAWRPPPRNLALAWTVGALAFLAAALASPYRAALGSPDPSLAAACGVSLGLAAAPPNWGSALLKAWRWALLALAAYALAQRLGLEPFTAYALAGSRQRALGSFGNAGYCAAFFCLSWPLALRWKGRARAAALALLGAALSATQSRAALIAVLVQAAAWALRRRRSGAGTRACAAAGSAPVWVWAMVPALCGLWFWLLFPPSQWSRSTLRWPLWRAALDLWLQRPWLGWGPRSFALAFQDHAPAALRAVVNTGNQYAEDAHQLLLELACAAGILGLAAFAGFAALFFREALDSPLPEAPALGLGALGLLVECQADRFFFQPGLFVPLAAAFGLLARRDAPAPPAGRGSSAAPPLRRGLAWACMALTFVTAWQAGLIVARYRQGVGPALDSGVGSLAVAGDPGRLAAQAGTHPTDPVALERLGDALAARRQYQGAAQALQEALDLQATPGRAQNLGNCYLMLGRLAQAEAAFRVAVRLAPDNADAHFSLGYALFYEKRLKDALVELDTALRLDPSHAGAAQLKRQILP